MTTIEHYNNRQEKEHKARMIAENLRLKEDKKRLRIEIARLREQLDGAA